MSASPISASSTDTQSNLLNNLLNNRSFDEQSFNDNDASLFAFADEAGAPDEADKSVADVVSIPVAQSFEVSPFAASTPVARTSPEVSTPETPTFETARSETFGNETFGGESSTRTIENIGTDAGVHREVAMTTMVYVALGSNLGDRLANLREAVARLERHPSFKMEAKSRVYETESVEGGGEAAYLNAVIRATWGGSPMSLLRCVQGVEERMGRPRPPRNGPRLIDVDILLFGDTTVENAHLVIPHPRMMQRAFVLRPLCDVLQNGWLREFPLGSL